MKAVSFLLFLVLSSLNGGVTQTNLFKAGKVYTYDVILTFRPNSDSSLGNSEIKEWKVKYLLNVTVIELNKIVLQTGTYRLFKGNKGTKEFPILSCLQNELELPVEVTLGGRVQPISIKFQQNLSEWSMNIKKLEISRFILNTEISFVQYNNVEIEEQLEYVVLEKSIMGHCETKYIVLEHQQSFTSINLVLNITRDEAKYKVIEGQTEEDALWRQQHLFGTNNDQHSWSNMEEDFHNVDYIQRFCATNSTLYKFQKTTDLRHCQISENSEIGRLEDGMVETKYFACGSDLQNVVVLQISNQITADKLVEKISLVDISEIDRTEIPSFSIVTEPITNFYTSSFETWYNFLNYACNDIEKPNPAELRKGRTQGGEHIQKFRACIQRSSVHPNKLVLRDLNSDQYNHLNLQWNLRKEKVYPLAYFVPTTARDVAKAVKCGLDTEIHLVPNSGGHSYEAIGWGNNDTVVVDFRKMNKISIVGSGSQAIGLIEPGALVGPINAYFWENGGYALPMGTCMAVGIGGHAIGGGAGHLSNLYGLTIDHVIEYEFVDGRGQIIIANQNLNADLFWALRGVGPGYIGIVTSFKVKLVEAHRMRITYVALRYPIKQFAPAYIGFQNMLKWIEANEPTIHMEILLSSDKYNSTTPPVPAGIKFIAVHIQDPNVQPKGNASFLKALFKTFPKPAAIIQEFPNYIQNLFKSSYSSVISAQATTKKRMEVSGIGTAELYENTQGTKFMNLKSDAEVIAFLKSMRKEDALPRYFKTKSFFIKKYFTLAQMKRVAHVLRSIPPNYFYIQCTSELGRIHRIGKNETAYVHRDSILQFIIQYEGPSDLVHVHEGMTYLYKLWDAIQFMDGGETYQNLVDLDVQDSLAEVWGVAYDLSDFDDDTLKALNFREKRFDQKMTLFYPVQVQTQTSLLPRTKVSSDDVNAKEVQTGYDAHEANEPNCSITGTDCFNANSSKSTPEELILIK